MRWHKPQISILLRMDNRHGGCTCCHPSFGFDRFGGLVWTQIPHGAEDETGDWLLAERAGWLPRAAFFLGLSSGVAWLAWAVGTPVMMASGFTHPTNEFATPYRVIQTLKRIPGLSERARPGLHTPALAANDSREG
jgi:hypothetical protein